MPCLNRVCIGKYMNKCIGGQPFQDISPIFKYSTSLNSIFREILRIFKRNEHTFSWISLLMFSEMQFLIIFPIVLIGSLARNFSILETGIFTNSCRKLIPTNKNET